MSIVVPDFDTLVALHEHDPHAFEELRRSLLRDAVDSAPVVHREALEQLLERIESARESITDPADAAFVAFRMMQDSVEELHDQWECALSAIAGLQTAVLLERMRH